MEDTEDMRSVATEWTLSVDPGGLGQATGNGAARGGETALSAGKGRPLLCLHHGNYRASPW